MIVKCNVQKAMRRLLCSRRGTAEIVGSVMFLLIMMFFFTNVFLWHDRATREMDGVLAEKMNSPVSIQIVKMTGQTVLSVTNNGGVDAYLSRLWIIDDQEHSFVDVEGTRIPAGDTIYDLPIDVQAYGEVTFKVITTRGNSAACKYVPPVP